ncbi:MAG TPA: hypothetical protein VNO52_14000 [Methylomirabilota bacterium]|nr:hypothetical protein [Methylomirabilota bacterium]
MSWQRRLGGGTLALVGFLLSPLSWWNDAFINVPLAYGFASLVSWPFPEAFEISWIAGYWLTNVLGLVLMQKGARHLARPEASRTYTRRDLLKDILVSLAYTALIAVLIISKVLKPIPDYFRAG